MIADAYLFIEDKIVSNKSSHILSLPLALHLQFKSGFQNNSNQDYKSCVEIGMKLAIEERKRSKTS